MNGIHNTLTLTGRVVETFLRDGKQIAKISLQECQVFVPMDAILDAHLGDIVSIDAEIAVHKVEERIDAAQGYDVTD